MKIEKYNVLIVDDDQVDREKIKRLLLGSDKYGFDIFETAKASDGLYHSMNKRIDCVLLDYMLPQINGIEFINRLQGMLEDGLPTIIMLTSQGDEKIAANAIKSGAKDYLIKSDLNTIQLEKTIISNIKQTTLEKEILDKNNKLKTLAMLDGLTGLPNRRAFDSALKRFYSASQRYKRLSALLFIDLNQFKNINDTLGHSYGDQLLQQVSDRLKEEIRDSDMVARIGGDEFAIILNEINDPAAAGLVADKLIKSLSHDFHLHTNKVNIGASIGITCFPDDTNDHQEVTVRADTAMYRSKETGQSSYQYYKKEFHEKHQYLLQLNQFITSSIIDNELFLVYQPIVDLNNNKIIGVEALMRWESKKLNKIIPPIEFIPVAESSGFINELGYWLLKNALNDLASWKKQYEFDGFISINLSPIELTNSDYYTQLDNILIHSKVPIDQIHFEVTEQAIMNDLVQSKPILNKINDTGLEIHIDDFGTGYSSLNRIKNLPITGIKIDRSFVNDIGDDDNNILIKTIMGMANNLNLDVIAEGIETKEQLDYLKELNCNKGQGYLMYKPLLKKDFIKLIKK